MQSFEGRTIGHYHILEPLGKGGMAIVYHAYDTRLERDVAIKLIRTEAIPAEHHDRLIRRFERETRAMAKFSHPNIVPVHDYGKYQDIPYLVMDYLPGGTLKQYTGKPMNYRQAAALLAPIADALSYAHGMGVVHRDVKPSNILVTKSGNVMLTDFGIAKLLEDQDATLTGTGLGVGTPQYMAPEQWKNQITPSVDIYALGTIFYELITGVKPYNADTPAAIAIMQATEPLTRPRHFVPALPEAVEKVLFKALAFKPENRYPTMDDYCLTLSQVSHGQLQKAAAPIFDDGVSVDGRTYDALGESTTIDKLSPSYQAIRVEQSPPVLPEANKKRSISPIIWIVIGLGLLGGAIFGFSQLINPPKETISYATGVPMVGVQPTEKKSGAVATVIDVPTDQPTNQPTTQPTFTAIPSTTTPVPTATQALGIGSSLTRASDGMTMMYIPQGAFIMGSDSGDSMASENEFPQHSVVLSAFWIDEHEVTNAMFEQFVKETGYVTQAEKDGLSYILSGENWVPQNGANWQYPQGGNKLPDTDSPVVHVNLYDAQTYCQWSGVRLPTEAEWEKAARGTDGAIYPWGAAMPTGGHLNMADQSIGLSWSESFTDGYQYLSPVKQYPTGASLYGVYDMAGNAWELVNSCFTQDYNSTENCNYYILKGGSFSASLRHVRAAGRKIFLPVNMHGNLGFRCVMDAD